MLTADLYSAAAPLTISMISLVIAAWRARFIVSVSDPIMSVALFVAESIAVMRELIRLPDVVFTDLFDRKNLIHDQALRNHRFKFVEDHVHGIDFATRI